MVLGLRLSFNTFFMFVLTLLFLSQYAASLSKESLTKFVANEKVILKEIRGYQQRRMDQLKKLQRKIEFIDQEHKRALGDVTDYLSNAINAYKLIKRIVIDWKVIQNFIMSDNMTKDFIDAWKTHMEYVESPSESDFQDAIHELTSIPNDIDGSGSELIYGSEMTWDECYEIGIHVYIKNDFHEALSWLQMALGKLKDTQDFNEMIRVDIMEYIAYSQYMLGDAKEAALTLEQVLDIPVENSTLAEARAYMLLNVNSFVEKAESAEPHYLL